MQIARSVAAAMVIGLAIVTLPSLAFASESSDHVVITRPGVVFHKVGAGDTRGRSVEKTIKAAVEGGYAACRVCFGNDPGLMQFDPRSLAAAGTSVGLGVSTSNISISPQSTVMQPFGVKARAHKPGGINCHAIGDPFALPETRRFGRAHGSLQKR
jgi:hypothetical protein